MSISTVIIPVRGGTVHASDLEAIAEITTDVPAGVHTPRIILLGDDLKHAAAQLGGVASGVVVELAEVDSFAPLRWVRSLAREVANSMFVLAPGSPDGRDLAAQLASELRWAFLSPAMSVTADRVELVRRAGNALAEVIPTEPFVATLQPGVRGVGADMTRSTTRCQTSVLTLQPEEVHSVTVLEVTPPDPETMELQEAPRIVGIGAGLIGAGDTEHRVSAAVEFATLIGASMGATRVVTDAGFVEHDRQIGTTGVVVDPTLYVNFAISGAVQHTAGLGHPDHIISVNTDPHCPMMAMADLAVVADAQATVGHLVSLLTSQSGSSGNHDGAPESTDA